MSSDSRYVIGYGFKSLAGYRENFPAFLQLITLSLAGTILCQDWQTFKLSDQSLVHFKEHQSRRSLRITSTCYFKHFTRCTLCVFQNWPYSTECAVGSVESTQIVIAGCVRLAIGPWLECVTFHPLSLPRHILPHFSCLLTRSPEAISKSTVCKQQAERKTAIIKYVTW